MPGLRVFVVDDEATIRVSTTDDLREAGFDAQSFDNPLDLLDAMSKQKVDIVISDIKMPAMDGIELLRRIKSMDSGIFVIMMTAFGSVDTAVQAMKAGAFDYLTKPFTADEILLRVQKIDELIAVKRENAELRTRLGEQYDFSAVVGHSTTMRETFDLIRVVVGTNTTVLITGETGTGKELIANVIHYNSLRHDRPMVKVSCAILSREIFESELFGHEKGAFTGAIKEKQGKFELADTGTIYLDDVDDIPIELQVKLLRVLEERELERVGGSRSIKVDVRVIASTKADLKRMVDDGKFREDLYYRLNVFPIRLKPLRERREDIRDLVQYYIKKFSPDRAVDIDAEVLPILENCAWEGNVRELRNVVERMVLMSPHGRIDIGKVPCEIISPTSARTLMNIGEKPLDEMLSEIEKNALKRALTLASGNKTRAAELLSIPVSTLRTKIDKHKLDSGH